MVATWGKRAPPLHFRREARLLWQRGISGFDEISRAPSLVVHKFACTSFLMNYTGGKKKYKHKPQHIFLYTYYLNQGMVIIVNRNKQSPDFNQIFPANGAWRHLSQISSGFFTQLVLVNRCCKPDVMFMKQTPWCSTERRGVGGLLTGSRKVYRGSGNIAVGLCLPLSEVMCELNKCIFKQIVVCIGISLLICTVWCPYSMMFLLYHHCNIKKDHCLSVSILPTLDLLPFSYHIVWKTTSYSF